MTLARFLVMVADDAAGLTRWRDEIVMRLDGASGFACRELGHTTLIVTPAEATLDLGGEGVVIGSMFARGRTTAAGSIAEDEVSRIVTSGGSWLVQAYWGDYIAVFVDRESDQVHLLRSPFSDLPCLVTRRAEGHLFASDVGMLEKFTRFVPSVAWGALARHLAAPLLATAETCMAGVASVPGGHRVTLSDGRSSTEALWDIWSFIEAGRRIEDPEEAVHRLRDAIGLAITAKTQAFAHVLLRLSGGLDSSILAAGLCAAPKRCTALTLTTRDAAGDERVHARSVARHLGIPLLERARSLSTVDVTRSAGHRLPRPAVRAFVQAASHAVDTAALQVTADAVVDGGGGDNVFASLCSPAPVADCLRIDGGTGRFWKTARSIGEAAGTSTLAVARAGIWRHWTRGPGYRWPLDLDLLSAGGREMAAGVTDHPWLNAPHSALPGGAAHVALLAAASSVPDNRDAADRLPTVSPFIAQPLIEVALRIPSWLWTRRGHDRAVAREAFRPMLPSGIVDRRDKGSPDGFVAELFAANQSTIRDMLTEGLLVGKGLVDPQALTDAFAATRSLKGFGHRRLMQLLDAEAWARSWS